MKNIYTLIIVLLLVSCGAAKEFNGIPGKKTLKGEWQVDQIEFFGAKGTYKAFMFDTADSYCFKNSIWMFIPNNNTGKFTTVANSSNCEFTNKRIRWSYYDGEGQRNLQFKFVDSKNKTLDPANKGYRLKIKDLNQTNMTIEVDVEYEGNPFIVSMSLSKISTNVVL
jgi:hypothetical protein